MAKRKCKPVEQWVQLHLFPHAEHEIERLEYIMLIRSLPSCKNWKPHTIYYPNERFV